MTVFDASHYTWPYSVKYLQETPMFSDWMIFGEYPGTDLVDIADTARGNSDIMLKVPRAKAEKIVAAREEFARKLLVIMNDTEPT
ncbi:hypothetical protein CC53_gp133 [Rhizobium phage vB_RleS_L338C]|uniref:hypothetical protein n=1 Tax=Rhizobium phage vB_RleS_L338C TaxID=1414737 RepID=UPI0003D921FC|nr:hypothetical protein CC53_gp133 [Rhizobium phage vB_RleS_L338C]AHC30550.1 hypothetical protein L338C_133 [Rhizobium phage vB_RleS_L338C]QNH72161.1 hypothetical protein P11VFA_017 [Rhizobium phage P11VFA]